MTPFAILLGSVVGCSNPPKLPVGKVKALNTHPQSGEPYALVFDLEKDFDGNLKLRPEAKGEKIPLTFQDLNRHWALDADTKEELTRYALEWKTRYKAQEKQLKECRGGK